MGRFMIVHKALQSFEERKKERKKEQSDISRLFIRFFIFKRKYERKKTDQL